MKVEEDRSPLSQHKGTLSRRLPWRRCLMGKTHEIASIHHFSTYIECKPVGRAPVGSHQKAIPQDWDWLLSCG